MAKAPENGQTKGESSVSGRGSLRERVRQAAKRVESEIIIEALEQHRWNRRRTAAALNISYRSLMYKMKNCDLREEPRQERGAGAERIPLVAGTRSPQ